MEKKEKEHRDKMDALTRASQYVQAHWRGMLSRKEGEKARKKKKKGKGKKKWTRDFFPSRVRNAITDM